MTPTIKEVLRLSEKVVSLLANGPALVDHQYDPERERIIKENLYSRLVECKELANELCYVREPENMEE